MRVDISDKNRSTTTQFFVWVEWDSVSKKKKILKIDLSQLGCVIKHYYDEDKIITIIHVDLKTRFVIIKKESADFFCSENFAQHMLVLYLNTLK